MDGGLPDIARATVASRRMFPQGGPVVAMVSGGADSVSLLRLLAAGALGDVRLSVLHVDHMLRGAASDADASFVEGLCRDLAVPCRVVRYDVGAFADARGLNLEDAGRRVRYRFAEEELDARCHEADADPHDGRIAVAHTADDRVETFLMRVAAGAGSGGLSGIPYVRGRIVRPLLDARRSDVVTYLTLLGQVWREDATNADTSRVRARVRAEAVPLFEALNPRFVEAAARTLTLLSDDEELLDGMARAFVTDFAEVREGEVAFDRARMATLAHAMRRRTLRAGLLEAFPHASRIEFEHVEALATGMASEGFSRDLPDGLRAFSEYGTLVISRTPDEAPALAPTLLEVPGSADLGPAGSMTAEWSTPEPSGTGGRSVVVDASRIRGALVVDAVRPGDRMRPLGMTGTRKLQDVLTDAKVPRRSRQTVPVVRDGDAVVWVAGVHMSEDYRIVETTERAVRISWTGPADQEE